MLLQPSYTKMKLENFYDLWKTDFGKACNVVEVPFTFKQSPRHPGTSQQIHLLHRTHDEGWAKGVQSVANAVVHINFLTTN